MRPSVPASAKKFIRTLCGTVSRSAGGDRDRIWEAVSRSMTTMWVVRKSAPASRKCVSRPTCPLSLYSSLPPACAQEHSKPIESTFQDGFFKSLYQKRSGAVQAFVPESHLAGSFPIQHLRLCRRNLSNPTSDETVASSLCHLPVGMRRLSLSALRR